MKLQPLAATLAVATVLVLGTAILPAQAATDAQISSALSRIDNGTYTNADLTLLVNAGLGNQVPDPNDTGALTSANGVDTTTAQLLADGVDATDASKLSSGCGFWVDVAYTKHSLLGDTIYKYHHKVVFCRSGGKVTRFQNRYDYITNEDGFVYWREQVVNQRGGVGTTAAWSHLQRHIEYCLVKYGCYANTYPWSLITVYGTSGYKYTGANS